MSKNDFTLEQIEALKQNQYVLKVSSKSIQFSHEFKQKIFSEKHSGKSQKFILSNLGIDANVLGRDRVTSLFKRIGIQANRPEKFGHKPIKGRPKKLRFSSLEEENQYLRSRTEYLEQENEFLKKIEALEGRDLNTYARKKNLK